MPFNLKKTFGERSFSFAGPVLWISLLKKLDSVEMFKNEYKTFLLKKKSLECCVNCKAVTIIHNNVTTIKLI